MATEPAVVERPQGPPSGDNLLETRALRKEFGGLIACNDVDFRVPRGGIVSLIGPNGAGKTTFFNMLTGVYTPTAGEIVFDGTEVAGLPPHQITALGVGSRPAWCRVCSRRRTWASVHVPSSRQRRK